jgi:hypothetical protein
LSGPDATDRLVQKWTPSIEKDPDLAATFWLALAVTQWKCGRLEDRVRQEAMHVIDDGSALRPWSGTEFERKRIAVLEAARKQLESPQPLARKIPRVFPSTCAWELGELIAYRLLSGDFIVFQVIGHHTDAGGVAPVCEIFEWRGREIPQPSEPEGVQTRAQIPFVFKNRPPQPSPAPRPQYRLMIGQVSKREFPKDRVFRMNAKPPISVHDSLDPRYAPTLGCLWRTLDRELEMHYNLR